MLMFYVFFGRVEFVTKKVKLIEKEVVMVVWLVVYVY